MRALAPLAFPAGPLEPHPAAQFRPVGRIQRAKFSANRHCRWISIVPPIASSAAGCVEAKRLFTRASQSEAMRELILTTAMIAAVALPAKADEQSWGNGVTWNQAFPEHEQLGAALDFLPACKPNLGRGGNPAGIGI